MFIVYYIKYNHSSLEIIMFDYFLSFDSKIIIYFHLGVNKPFFIVTSEANNATSSQKDINSISVEKDNSVSENSNLQKKK
jgi:hypothetical protein